ncbi:Hint domain-containing protein, partial [Acidisphaera rubrifaciens]|uniref:Hint domain-containing protein n=1 Tax=Acidisphaera rubrifaciens TaxID=50715 RepID=UPI000AA3D723
MGSTLGFLAGTQVLTSCGPIPIEALVEGELVVTRNGQLAPVLRLDKQRFSLVHVPRTDAIQPVCIARGALGDGLPHRDIVLAPDQCVAIDDVVATARELVNGGTITRIDPPPGLAYFDVTLPERSWMMAEGVACATRAPTRGRRGAARATATLPRDGVTAAGAQHRLAALRARLLDVAYAAGYRREHDPDPYLVVAGRTLRPDTVEGLSYRFTVPVAAGSLEIVSRSFVPRDVSPGSGDERVLGVAVRGIRIGGGDAPVLLDLDDPAHQGLHLPQDDGGISWRWTDGHARLRWQADRAPVDVTITLAHDGLYWIAPPVHAAAEDDGTAPPGTRRGIAARAERAIVISGEPETPGHAYRVARAVDALCRHGIDARAITLDEVGGARGAIARADHLLIWRAPLHAPGMEDALAAAREGGAHVVFDLDDVMTDARLARPDVIDAIRFNGYDSAEIRRLYDGMLATLQAADAVTCTTPELAAHLRPHGKPVHVIPNGFDATTLAASRRAVRQRRLAPTERVVRLGYAGGSRTHQADFRPVAEALGRLLPERPDARLVLFRHPVHDVPLVDVDEYPGLAACAAQIEWRDMVPVAELPAEIARFDINLAPLQVGNPFCEAKSELKYFEAALVEVCTVASPTGPFRRAIRDGETGFLADGARAWQSVLRRLIDDASLRRRTARAAYHDVLWRYGPEARAEHYALMLGQSRPGADAARAFELAIRRAGSAPAALPHIPQHSVVHAADRLGEAATTVLIPLYNYGHYVREALDSAYFQTEEALDLVVVDDRSTDDSLDVVLDWVGRNGGRFNRVVVLQNLVNSGLGLTRNAGFAAAETPFVLPLDADNRLFPRCVEACRRALQDSGAAFAYPTILEFGEKSGTFGGEPFAPMRLAAGNFIDAMALVRKSGWAAVGGYDHVRTGWEDYDLWCRMAERGLWGRPVADILAEYRVHGASMLRTLTDVRTNKRRILAHAQTSHPWTAVRDVAETAARIEALERNAIRTARRGPRAADAITPA